MACTPQNGPEVSGRADSDGPDSEESWREPWGVVWKVLEGQIGSMECRVQDGKPQRPVWPGVTSDQDGLARYQGRLAGSWPICEHRGAGDSPLGCVPV